jgi:hypothetical protein
MAATLEEVIEKLKDEGQLTRVSEINSSKDISQKIEAYGPVFESIKTSLLTQNAATKEALEAQKRKDDLDGLNTNGSEPPPAPVPPPAPDANRNIEDEGSLSAIFKLGLLGSAFTIAVSASIAVITSQLKEIAFFAKFFVPSLATGLNNFKTSVITTFVNFGIAIRDTFNAARQSLSTTITNAITSIRNAFSITAQSPIANFINSLSDRIKLVSDIFRDGIVAIKSLFTSSTALNGYFTKIGDFLRAIGSSVSWLGKILGKIFLPLNIIITAFETIKGAIDGYAEGGKLGFFEGAINGFFTSLITVPLDLIKNMVGWVVGKLGFDETSEAIKSFSFTTLFTNMTAGVFDFLRDTFEWVKTLFSDPVTALKQLWNGYVGEGGFLDLVWTPVSLAIDWVSKKFGFRDEDAPTFNLLSYLKDVWSGVRNMVVEKFQDLTGFFSSIPDRIQMFAEGMFIDVSEKIKIGFAEFGDWISSIPARIKLMALNAISSATSLLPEWAQIVSKSDLNEAQSNVNNGQNDFRSNIDQIKATAAAARLDLETRMGEFQMIERNAAKSGSTILINQSPVIAPSVQNNVRGGSSSNQTFISGGGNGGGSSLDYGMPRGIN